MPATHATSAFDAIADPHRRRILELLKSGESSAGQLAQQFSFSWPALSQHLAILKEAKLVSVRRDGRFLYYSACPETLENECAVWINEYTAFWKAKLGDLKAYLESETAPRKARRGRALSDDAAVTSEQESDHGDSHYAGEAEPDRHAQDRNEDLDSGHTGTSV